MDITIVINILLTVILAVVGFLMSRLYKSIDNLYNKIEKLPTKDDVQITVDNKILEHRVNLHQEAAR